MTQPGYEDALNQIANAVKNALGDSVDDGSRWLPLSVRYEAARAAVGVVLDWRARAT